MKCDRCQKEDCKSVRMSFFNTQMLCPECEDKERHHPMYQKAKDIEMMHVKQGNYNFVGIGCPEELLKRSKERKATATH